MYDPATHAFLTRDPVAGIAGGPGSATNPYLYAANDPLQYVDPLGLKPITADEANQQMQAWKKGHWEIVVGAVALADAAALVIATGGLASPLLIPAIIGAGSGALGPSSPRPCNTSRTGNRSASTPSRSSWTPASAAYRRRRRVPFQRQRRQRQRAHAGEDRGLKFGSTLIERGMSMIYGAGTNAGATALDTEANGGRITWQTELVAAGGGTVGGLPPHVNQDVQWKDVTDLSPKQVAVAESGSRAANFYTKRVAAAVTLAKDQSKANLAKNLRSDAWFGGGGSTASIGINAAAFPDPGGADAAVSSPATPSVLYPALANPGPPPVFP